MGEDKHIKFHEEAYLSTSRALTTSGRSSSGSASLLQTGSVAAAAFAIFTFCNIGPRAYNHHKWYLQKFEDYPNRARR